MSKEDAYELSQRELTRALINSFDSHKKESAEFREDVIKALAKIETNGFYSQKQLDEHDKDIDSLKGSRQHQRGATWVIGIVGGVAIADFCKRMFFH